GILSTLPMLLVIGYQRNQLAILTAKIREDLWLCGLDAQQLESKMDAFNQKNSWSAFVLPTILILIFLGVMWSFFLMPEGAIGLRESLLKGGELSIPGMLEQIVESPSVIFTTFLGAYFYTLMVSIRRWTRADLTTGVLWRINIRLAVALLLGFLLAAPTTKEGSVSSYLLPVLGFLGGIVPDTVLRWLTQQARKAFSPEDRNMGGLFRSSNLQEKIEGLNFWQVDRLFEEGIESLQDLAVKEIPDLLINTRFDTPLILYWVDQALLSNQAGGQWHLFQAAYIRTASGLMELAGEDQGGLAQVLKAIQDGQGNRPNEQGDRAENGTYTMSLPLLQNIVVGLRNGPNLPYAREYWRNTSTPQRRAAKLAELDNNLSSKTVR
ncbi:MAG TPA: hypothetical protein VLA49_07175, partial [Anaerolineales bacterium]|nr:hypothetical protein [Anaerolineales bacterium]